MYRIPKALILLILFALLPLSTQSQTTWISGLTVSTTSSTASLSWNTAVPAYTQARYGITPSYGNHTNLEANSTSAHVTSLQGLSPGTLYHFRLVAKDAQNIVVTGLDYTLTTQPAPVAVTVSPNSGTLASGASQQCSAQVTNATNTAVTWSATAGSVTSGGLFTAPVVSSTQNVTVTATSVADPTKFAAAVFTIAPPVQHSVGLSWQASGSSNIASYSAYRSLVSGGPYSLLASALTSRSYADSQVQPGTTYYYVVTATDNQGQESVDSNQASATVPSP